MSAAKSFFSDPRLILFINYLLLFLMVLSFGMTGVIVLLIATFLEDKAPDWLKSHYEFQKRTFWLGVIPLIACFFLAIILRGQGISHPILSLALVLVPLIYLAGRCAMGFNHLLYNRPYPAPKSWLV